MSVPAELTLEFDPKRLHALKYWLEHGYEVATLTLVGPDPDMGGEHFVAVPVVATETVSTDRWVWSNGESFEEERED